MQRNVNQNLQNEISQNLMLSELCKLDKQNQYWHDIKSIKLLTYPVNNSRMHVHPLQHVCNILLPVVQQTACKSKIKSHIHKLLLIRLTTIAPNTEYMYQCISTKYYTNSYTWKLKLKAPISLSSLLITENKHFPKTILLSEKNT